ncbi:MAG: hypothetical protein VKL39_00605 [Leptolyngbyaceae bacterium]|nr:hypothetical protein [Leptolyngbyaceae bacterium]
MHQQTIVRQELTFICGWDGKGYTLLITIGHNIWIYADYLFSFEAIEELIDEWIELRATEGTIIVPPNYLEVDLTTHTPTNPHP